MFIAIDAAMFSVIFLVMSHYRTTNVDDFTSGHAYLTTSMGLLNTLVLLTSSYSVAKGLGYARSGFVLQTKRHFSLAILLGLSFTLLKCYEYHDVIGQGGVYSKSDFFAYYFSFTGLHLFHVLLGMLGLWLCIKFYCKEEVLREKGSIFLESAALYWHLVDAVWVFLFLLIYLN